MRAGRFIVGGCVYRNMVHVRHCASVVQLALMSVLKREAPQFSGFGYVHTSNLPQGRALWLRDQIAQPDLRWAISIDSDTEFKGEDLILEIPIVEGQIAIGVAPVRIGGTELCNVNITEADDLGGRRERRAFASELGACLEGDRLIASGGFGLAVFNLDWFRTSWPDPAPERASIDTGEDIELCRSVRDRGGLIAALRVRTNHHEFKG